MLDVFINEKAMLPGWKLISLRVFRRNKSITMNPAKQPGKFFELVPIRKV